MTVIRPSKVHGPGSFRPREWVFVKRVLDRRPAVLLAHRGDGADHPTAAANIAALIEVAAAKPGRRILNCADPDTPNGLEISRMVARHLGHDWDEVLVDDGSPGGHPWDMRPPIVLDMAAAAELGYVPAGDYAATVAEEIDWLVESARRWTRSSSTNVLRLRGRGPLPRGDRPADDERLAQLGLDRLRSAASGWTPSASSAFEKKQRAAAAQTTLTISASSRPKRAQPLDVVLGHARSRRPRPSPPGP